MPFAKHSDRLARVRHNSHKSSAIYPFPSACAAFSRVKAVVWLPVFGVIDVRTYVDARDCTRGLYGHRKRVFTGS